ncbi:CHASE2 domain-containing protein [Nostoc punctiforme]|uniref:Putative Chase2 sensor protein n=1 Tax=Nostoc punctiforme (strain ATCC 29133 / PCC 73102) TaxID=63737 RepID=B2JAL4_NOSP7|nr:CHASE2 domain-containing protein [Nostoc punctiforme]ACC84968.1 putative Chase2 sensor protein [Nostoc punctiforme PCC 73102]
MTAFIFNLKVQQFDQLCAFELSWGKGQQLGVTLAYPNDLDFKYQEWQRIYLRFYNTKLRSRVEEIGSFTAPPVDWHLQLVQAEAQLLSEFHHWLRSAELHEIRATIAQATRKDEHPNVDLFLTCNPLDLARLPWEAWEIGTEFSSSSSKIRIVRTPINRRETVSSPHDRRSGKTRILVILGDETGLDFQAEKQAMIFLKSVAKVEFIGWQPQESIPELKTKIVQAIASESGWDILLFAGHSNETNLTGGEIAIAPNTALSISEIAQPLIIAKQRGLQFAIFNSCNGLSIANKLIDLGLSQVAVMREPIHNQVAGEFLLEFIKALAQYQDVHESMITAAQHLKLENSLTYPSAYLIPSLFCHPEATLFRFQPSGIKPFIQYWRLSRKEAIALSILLLISLILPVQTFLLQWRVWVQAIYRDTTNQSITSTSPPPVLLVQIDEDSIIKAKISDPKPIDYKYLASLIDRLSADKAKVIGIDYLLSRHQPQSDRILAKSIQAAVSSPNHTLFVFAATGNQNKKWLQPLPEIANFNWSLSGDIKFYPWYISLLPHDDFQTQPWYFSNLLVLGQQLQQISDAPQPKLDSQTDYFQQMGDVSPRNLKSHRIILQSPRSRLQLITALSYQLWQMWLHPIADFSIPPNQIYHTIPAWKVLENQTPPQNLQQQVVIIIPGGYDEAGISQDGEDNFADANLPPAIKYWQPNTNLFTGGEYHAYMIHHLLNQRLVVPIPDFWVTGIALLLGKILYLQQKNRKYRWQWLLLMTIFTGIYGIISLQLYISTTAILLPCFLPSIGLWVYFVPNLLSSKKS